MRGGLDPEGFHGVSPVCSSEAYQIVLQTSLICHFSQRWQSEVGLQPKLSTLYFLLPGGNLHTLILLNCMRI